MAGLTKLTGTKYEHISHHQVRTKPHIFVDPARGRAPVPLSAACDAGPAPGSWYHLHSQKSTFSVTSGGVVKTSTSSGRMDAYTSAPALMVVLFGAHVNHILVLQDLDDLPGHKVHRTDKVGHVFSIIAGDRHEQSAGVLNTVGCQMF